MKSDPSVWVATTDMLNWSLTVLSCGRASRQAPRARFPPRALLAYSASHAGHRRTGAARSKQRRRAPASRRRSPSASSTPEPATRAAELRRPAAARAEVGPACIHALRNAQDRLGGNVSLTFDLVFVVSRTLTPHAHRLADAPGHMTPRSEARNRCTACTERRRWRRPTEGAVRLTDCSGGRHGERDSTARRRRA